MSQNRSALLEYLEKSSKEVGRQSRNSVMTNRRNIQVANRMYKTWEEKAPTNAQIVRIAQDPQTSFFARLKLLFFLRRQYPWRQWSRMMQYILHDLQLMICHDRSLLHQMQEISDVQEEIHRLLDLTCNNLQGHLVILVQTLLQNKKISKIFDQKALSLRMVAMAKQIPPKRIDVLWTIVDCDFDDECIFRIMEWPKETTNDRGTILPILTMLANYVVKTDVSHVQQIIAHKSFQTLISNLLHSESKYEEIRELQLLINNCLVKSRDLFIQVSKQQMLLKMLLQHASEERPIMCSILVEGHRAGIAQCVDQLIMQEAYRSVGQF